MVGRLDPQIVRSAEDAARRLDFDDVIARGRALSRRRAATTVTVAAMTAAVLVGVTQLPDRHEATPVVPSPTPTPTPSPTAISTPSSPRPTPQGALEDLTATQIVDHPDAEIVQVEQAGEERAVVWRVCSADASCREPRQAIALIADDPTSRLIPDRTWGFEMGVVLAPTGEALVLNYGYNGSLQQQVVRADGRLVDVDVVDAQSPVADGEVAAGYTYLGTRTTWWATDVTSARTHPIPVPDDTRRLTQRPDGRLEALTTRETYAWSDDHGETWQELGDAGADTEIAEIAASAPDEHVLTVGGDSGRRQPLDRILRLDAAGAWQVVAPPTDPGVYLGPTAVLPDGRFLMSVHSWTDDSTRPGIYVSDGDDWSTYERVDSGAPFERPSLGEPRVIDIDVAADGALITALGPDGSTVWTSKDLGATWLEMRAR